MSLLLASSSKAFSFLTLESASSFVWFYFIRDALVDERFSIWSLVALIYSLIGRLDATPGGADVLALFAPFRAYAFC